MSNFMRQPFVQLKGVLMRYLLGGDGQAYDGETTIMKNGAKKVKKIFKGKVLTGFAGSVVDAFSLTDTKFENKLQEHDGNLKRARSAC